EVDDQRIERRLETDYLMERAENLDEALDEAEAAADAGEPYSVAVEMNVADMLETMAEWDFVPDVVTDQTSSHDELEGYYPSGYTVDEADELREKNPERYVEESLDTMERHVDAILDLQDRGAT